MQSVLLTTVLAIFSIFMLSEFSRNDSVNKVSVRKAENIAANIIQYQNSISNYMLSNYDELHLPVSANPGNVEQIHIINYTGDQIAKFNKKQLLQFLNYQSIIFNYSQVLVGENQPMPLLYMATTWDGYSSNQIELGYRGVNMDEVMGYLGEDLSKHMYQGDSTYWTVPWIFSQSNCQITEVYMQLPNNSGEASKLKDIFNRFCTQIQTSGSYQFMKYVYIAPLFNNDI
jgi:hypothetical protein